MLDMRRSFHKMLSMLSCRHRENPQYETISLNPSSHEMHESEIRRFRPRSNQMANDGFNRNRSSSG